VTTVDLPSLEDWPTMGDDGDTSHRYPVRADGRRPQPGDRAHCGHIKQQLCFPSNAAADASGLPRCETCERIAREGGWILR
jgi:hypothetical protein